MGCVSTTPLQKSTSIEDYCAGVGNFVYDISERVGDYNRINPNNHMDVATAKQLTLNETNAQVKDLPPAELIKIMDMIDFVFDNLTLTPDRAARSANALCLKQRHDGTWFKK